MKMNDRPLSVEESLALITDVIGNTRRHVERSAYIPFLVWGYATIVVALLVWWGYSHTADMMWFTAWAAIPVMGCTGMAMTRKRREVQGYVRTPIDRVLAMVWAVLAVAGVLVTLVSFVHPIPTLFIIVMLMGAGCAMTGLILRMRLIAVAGFAGILLSLLFLVVAGINQCLIFALIFMIMMVLPGHILQYRLRNE